MERRVWEVSHPSVSKWMAKQMGVREERSRRWEWKRIWKRVEFGRERKSGGGKRVGEAKE